ncbi:hypothetical protein CGQ24_11940 [Arthrobacter sp. 7749]|nr:hypothetical protein CGQ24_11940 [Arthrobacter sp. 7749]
MNPTHGAYRYVDFGTFDDVEASISAFKVPPTAELAEFTVLPWRDSKAIRIGSRPMASVEFSAKPASEEDPLTTISSFVASIAEHQVLIIQHTTAPEIGHPSLLLRPNRLAKEFVDLGAKIIFLPFSRVPGGVRIIDDNTLMVSREHWPILQTVIGRRSGSENVFICSSFPDNDAIFTTDYLKTKNWQIIYEVRDDMEEFNRVGYSKWFDPMLERRMARLADRVITVSPRLAQKMDIIARRSDSLVIPNAVSASLISSGSAARGEIAEKNRENSKIVGYLGHLTASWFDWSLIIDAANDRPDYSFEIIGHGMPDNLQLPENVDFLGPKGHEDFVEIALRWKVGLIPFKPSTLTFAVDPNKLYEYLAVGLRVVSAQMGSVGEAPATYVYMQRRDFAKTLDIAMNTNFNSTDIENIEEYLRNSNWNSRASKMLSIFKGTI